MRTFRQYVYLALAVAVAGVLGAGVVRAAYDQGDRDQDTQYQTDRDRYAEDRSGTDRSDRYQTDRDRYAEDRGRGDRSDQYQARNVQLERQIARQLRNEGLGEQGEIMILATGNRVILLGNVPDDDSKDLAGRAAKQVPGVSNIDNRLHVVKEAKQVSDTQLQGDVGDKLPDRLARNIEVQAQGGTVTLQGSVNNWRDAADAIDAAFASGAQQVNSELSVGAAAAGRYGAGTAGGYAPSYGYAPGTRGQAGTMGRRGQASASDLSLAQQVAQQLRQELPSEQNIQVVRPMSIYVTVKNGTATLHGYVRDANQKQQAEQIASSVSGIRNVTNDLTIFSGAGTMGRLGGQGQYGQGGAGGMTGTQMSTSDRRTAQQIQQQLQDQFPEANIQVTARRGTVTLQGTVSDSNEKQQAEQLAQSFPGVQDVQNNLTISGQADQQGFGAAGRQRGAYPPQGYIPSQQGMNEQDSQGTSSSQMGAQPGVGAPSDQGRFGTSGQQGAPSASDLALARQVAQKLQQELSGIRNVQVMRAGTIYVMATQGTVMLHGFIQDSNVKQQATAIARNIPGVRNVENTLSIGAAGGFAPSYGYVPGQRQQTQEGAGGQMGATEQDQSGRSGQAGAGQQLIRYRDQSQSTAAPSKAYGSSSADRSKATKIAQNLHSQLPNADVTVIVSGNTVTLWGTVPNAEDRQQAQQIARSASGIRNIQNNLTVGSRGMAAPGAPPQTRYIADTDEMEGMAGTSSTSSASDMALAHQVAQKLQQQLSGTANIQVRVATPNTIYVTASQGTVSLTGWISDQSIKQQAEQVAKSVSGVQSVRDLLSVGTDMGTGFPPLGYTPGQESQFGDQQFGQEQPDYQQNESQDSDLQQFEDQDTGSY